ncbi:sugar transferase [Roseibium sp. Sym1]|uniref:sugar transferase n=1 Tax=Roseibium sp. Sym1 TaxID=3016006 RepID=UPI0022B5502F|nr:sugar transferase [Roseibium sp. Sym1]
MTQVTAAILLLLLAPFMIALALLVWVVDRQSPLYLAGRTGKDGRAFRMVKYRSMRNGKTLEPAITAVGDARVTALGRILRNTKIDELPQLINILRGDMAFFGPRPEDPGIVDRCYNERMRRSLDFKPGLFSPGTLWALENFRKLEGAEDLETAYARDILPKRLVIDTAYFRRPSAGANLRLALATMAVLVKRIGSPRYRE